jgi:protein-S-isoprenylcysteine O-methyltransferase Ste14
MGWLREFLFRRGFVLPVTVTGVIPLGIVCSSQAWRGVTPVALAAGAGCWLSGLMLIIRTTDLFARHGGALAPWNPPKKMVSGGPYRYVRNPMILGIIMMLTGEALAFRSLSLGAWAGLFLLGQHLYICLEEEPALLNRFGEDYARYCREVPRWLPRLRATNGIANP